MTVVRQNISMEGAYQEAIEDAANRIFEASRPNNNQGAADTTDTTNDGLGNNNNNNNNNIKRDDNDDDDHFPNNTSSSYNDGVMCREIALDQYGNFSSLLPIESVLSALDDHNNRSDFMSSKSSDNNNNNDNDNDNDNDNFTDDCYDNDGIESDIIFLEEKKRILKKAPVPEQKEEAYLALNAHDIASGMEPSFRRTRNPSIWFEAKAIIEEHKIIGGTTTGTGGTNEEDNNEEAFDPIQPSPSNNNHCSRLSSSRSSSSSSILPDEQPLYNTVVIDVSTIPKKRYKIDLSMVEHISAEKFARDSNLAEKEPSRPTKQEEEEGDEEKSTSVKYLDRLRHHNCVSPTTRWCQEAGEMQSATDSSQWISQKVLNRILNLTNAVVTEHLRRERVQK